MCHGKGEGVRGEGGRLAWRLVLHHPEGLPPGQGRRVDGAPDRCLAGWAGERVEAAVAYTAYIPEARIQGRNCGRKVY